MECPETVSQSIVKLTVDATQSTSAPFNLKKKVSGLYPAQLFK